MNPLFLLIAGGAAYFATKKAKTTSQKEDTFAPSNSYKSDTEANSASTQATSVLPWTQPDEFALEEYVKSYPANSKVKRADQPKANSDYGEGKSNARIIATELGLFDENNNWKTKTPTIREEDFDRLLRALGAESRKSQTFLQMALLQGANGLVDKIFCNLANGGVVWARPIDWTKLTLIFNDQNASQFVTSLAKDDLKSNNLGIFAPYGYINNQVAIRDAGANYTTITYNTPKGNVITVWSWNAEQNVYTPNIVKVV